MKKILITGGAVFAYLDSVKIITNKFKGGLIANLANQIAKMPEKNEIIYLCSKDSKQPEPSPHIKIIHHNGLYDYMEKVLELTPDMNAIILGSAVANLIPKNKIEGKFPSHNYKPGDTINIEFTIAPRVIDEIKKINPNTHLFGFKLLSNVEHEELIRAAYGVLLESKAVTVFANDTKDLMQKYAVTKERGVHPIHNDEVAQWILDRMNENYYKTILTKGYDENVYMSRAKKDLKSIIKEHKNSFIKIEEGYVFGSAALRFKQKEYWRFITTARGKNEINDFAFVHTVNHDKKEVHCITNKKASLNAPLFHNIFRKFNNVQYILHFHHQRDDLITQKYATPGTYEDSNRVHHISHPSFNIKGHGCILSYNKKGELLK